MMQQGKSTTLVVAIKEGNSDAFAELFTREFRNIKFFAYQYLHNLSQSEDVAQDTFLALWLNRESIADDSNLKSLLLTIAKNKALNVLRAHLRFKKDSLEKAEMLLNIKTLNSAYIESQIDAAALAEAIEQTRKNLPEHILASFDLSRSENLTYEEIAKMRGITVKSVEYHIAVALKLFREKLAHFTNMLILILVLFFRVFCVLCVIMLPAY